MTLELRAASSFPLDELAALFSSAYQDYLVPMQFDEETLRFMARTFDLDPDAGLVALQDGAPVGLVNLGIRGDKGWIGGIGVVPEARRQGVGKALMQAVHEQARSRGIRRIYLEVMEANEGAFRLYEDLGYEVTRWLEIGSLEAEPGPSLDEWPWEEAHARIRALRTAPEPWQRDDDTLSHYNVLRGVRTEAGAAVFRITAAGPTLMQFAGDEDAARTVLSSLRRAEPVSLFNFPAGDPVLLASASLGGRTTLRQREMMLVLERGP